MSDPGPSPFKYHLELTPAQLKLTHEALRGLLAEIGEERGEAGRVIAEVLEKLPDEHAIAAIRTDDDGRRDEGESEEKPEKPEPPDLLA